MTKAMASCFVALALSFTGAARAGEVTLDDEMWHDMGSVSKRGYEWFYFDLQTADGSQVAIVFNAPNPFDPSFGRHLMLDPREHVGMLVRVSLPDGRQFDVRQNFHGARHLRSSKDPLWLSIGPSSFAAWKGANGLPVYGLRVEVGDPKRGTRFEADLSFASVQKGWKLRDGTLWQSPSGDRYHKWVVAQPRARARGWYRITERDGSATTAVVDGVGYHDHNYGNISLKETNDYWYWGRAYLGDQTLIYAKLFGNPRSRYDVPDQEIVFLANRSETLLETTDARFDIRGSIPAPNGMTSPREIEISARDPRNGDVFGVRVLNDRVTYSLFPFYLTHEATAELDCPPLRCRDERGSALNEQMDLDRLLKWYLREAFL